MSLDVTLSFFCVRSLGLGSKSEGDVFLRLGGEMGKKGKKIDINKEKAEKYDA